MQRVISSLTWVSSLARVQWRGAVSGRLEDLWVLLVIQAELLEKEAWACSADRLQRWERESNMGES